MKTSNKLTKLAQLACFTSVFTLFGCQANSANKQLTQPSNLKPALTHMEQSVYSKDIATITDHSAKTVSEKERQAFKDKLEGVIAEWANTNISMLVYKKRPYEISDVIVFNKSKDKVLMLTTMLRTEKGHGMQAGFCDVFVGKKHADGTWYFHHRGLPGYSYGYSKKHRNGVFFTPKELVFRSLQKEVRDNKLVKYGNINPAYFDNHMWRW